VHSRFRYHAARPEVRAAVTNLHSLGRDDSALEVTNLGRRAAKSVVVSMLLRHATFEFDEVETLAPKESAPLTRGKHTRVKSEDLSAAAPNWFRTAVRSVVSTAGELRIPIAVRYVDDRGKEQIRFQVLHCDEDLKVSVKK
jgi:hypothetical protein